MYGLSPLCDSPHESGSLLMLATELGIKRKVLRRWSVSDRRKSNPLMILQPCTLLLLRIPAGLWRWHTVARTGAGLSPLRDPANVTGYRSHPSIEAQGVYRPLMWYLDLDGSACGGFGKARLGEEALGPTPELAHGTAIFIWLYPGWG
ncbi:hypothetical protein SKAU_G00123420 [Synaphobranchus kaupii]|uniref:Uncharacterized protein n=1 Tax=Synaphobranchus kaupii TaxID=118154 RepID=A0A9Q1FPI8_SYNKA|nr:hypothetical protein SKAU_G00123420 [Synaphobranchus kaupii]